MAAVHQNHRNALSWTNARAERTTNSAANPRVADALALLAGIGFGAVVALVINSEMGGALRSTGGWAIGLGRLFAMTGAYLLIILVVLIARIPWLERTVGQHRLVRWHRLIGTWSIVLIAMHIVLVTIGYAQLSHVGILHQFVVFVAHYPDILASLVGFGLLVMAGVTSARIARAGMRYETWWVVHLYMYLGLALAFAHQVRVGVLFLGDPLARNVLIVLWATTALAVVVYRVGLPIRASSRHDLRVASVAEIAPGVHSVVMRGRSLADMAVSGGQFFQWRFLSPGLWRHANPYSLSALPQPPFLRITVKGVGDQSNAVAHLKPGTRVFVEGPYGNFTHHSRVHDRVTLIGAGVGVTPLRAMLEDLPQSVQTTVIIRVSRDEDVLHRDEFEALVARHHGELHVLVGSRHEIRLNARLLRKLAPSIDQSDVFISGPSGFNDHIGVLATELGVPDDRIHQTAFSF